MTDDYPERDIVWGLHGLGSKDADRLEATAREINEFCKTPCGKAWEDYEITCILWGLKSMGREAFVEQWVPPNTD